MTDPKPQFLEITRTSSSPRKIAYIKHEGTEAKPGIIWLPGLKSTMDSTKASFIANWAAKQDRTILRFDYSGHGQSDGDFENGTTSQWLEDALAVFEKLSTGPQLLVGSSMGGWIALLLLRTLAENKPSEAERLKGLVLVAPAWDMTEALMWQCFTPDIQKTIKTEGVYYRPSDYEDGPYAITANLIEDGRNHLFSDRIFDHNFSLRILHGMKDVDVPWSHSINLLKLLTAEDVILTLVKDGDHRLSRDPDIARLIAEIKDLS